MKNLNQIMQQAQQMQNKVKALQKELDKREFDGSAGGGVVTAKVNGKQELLNVTIKPECVDPSDVDMLEELVLTAVNQALTESSKKVAEAMEKVTGGMNLPGMS